ncbi:unnamed protein product [Musa textilis]
MNERGIYRPQEDSNLEPKFGPQNLNHLGFCILAVLGGATAHPAVPSLVPSGAGRCHHQPGAIPPPKVRPLGDATAQPG